jgi:hypothetical protein
MAVLVVMIIAVVGLVTAMRVERMSAHYAKERMRAELLARAGVEQVRALVLQATAEGKRWISMPGRIITSDASLTDGSEEVVDLFSAPAGTGTVGGIDAGRDFNRESLTGDGTGELDPHGGEMRVGWIYFRENGTRDSNQTPDTSNEANPIVGRVAFWTDDESSRINFNTAWKRQNNDADPNSPSRINVLALSPEMTEADADAIRAEVGRFPFSSPDDVLRVGGELADVLAKERFSATSRSSSPDTNPWGESKIVLTTRQDLAGDRPFLDVLKTPGTDPGLLINMSGPKTEEALNQIVRQLERDDWPVGSGSFIDKYGERNAQQLAIDILEYVRSVESEEPIVEGMRVLPTGRYSYDFKNITNPGTYFGTVRRPMLTEVGVWYGTPNNAGNCDVVWRFEVLFPGGLGLSPDDLDLVGKLIECTTVRKNPDGSAGAAVPAGSINTSNQTIKDYQRFQRGDDVFGVITVRRNNQVMPDGRPESILIRPVLNAGATAGDFNRVIWDVAPITAEREQWIEYQVDPVGVPLQAITSVQVADPRVNKLNTDWEQGAATFGDYNFNWKKAIAAFPPQDTDQGGAVSDAGMRIPHRKGTPGNPTGRVMSVGELGLIATGIGSGVPWRSVRLQPAVPNDPLPDWLLVDLFTAPVLGEDGVPFPVQPAPGKVNLNARIEPFDTAERRAPLEALVLGAKGAGRPAAAALADNIANRDFANANAKYGRSSEGLVSVGELAEIRGVADGGEETEDALRELVDLSAIRANAFRVHSVGQSLKQTPSGQLVIEAERSVVATLERSAPANIRIIHWKVSSP